MCERCVCVRGVCVCESCVCVRAVCVCERWFTHNSSSEAEATSGSGPNSSFQRDQKLEASGVLTAASECLAFQHI